MALKPLRKYDEGTDIAHVMNEVAEAGIVVRHHYPTSSGTGKPGDSANEIEVPTNASGAPLGVLVTDVVSIDLSRYNHVARFHRDEVNVCSPVTVVTHGFIYTDMVSGTPKAGDSAYWTVGGLLTPTNTGSTVVGKFRGKKDADGYAGVDVNIRV